MNVHFTYRVSKAPDVEETINQQLEKIRKRLQVFKPDMIAFYGSIADGPKTGFSVSLNLRLPSGQMAASSMSETATAAVKSAFDDLIEQLTKHKDHLRQQHKWPRRRRVGRTRPQPQVPFEETLAAIHPEPVSQDDITGFINANLPRLQRFVERDLRFRRNNGQLHLDQITPEEVIDEAIANALDDRRERPEKVSLEPWLYRLARSAMDRLSNQTRTEDNAISMDSSVRGIETDGGDESMLQFHQPDEMLTNENLIPDGRTANPEEIAANDEVVAMVETALRDTKPEDREAFILFTMEGFTTHEIASITDRRDEQVRESIARAREHLKKSLPVSDKLKNKLIEHSKTA